MALAVGVQAPDFTLPSTSGSDFTLSKDLAGKPCILYFYPKDFTSVCTKEACDFRDAFGVFRELDIEVIGISKDSIATHLKFKEENKLPFELLSDEKLKVSADYKAKIPIVKMPRRVTYLLDSNHHIAAVYEDLFNATGHIKEMINKVKAGKASGV